MKLIDLSVPAVKDFPKNAQKYLESFPVIIACMFQVFDSNSYFKPEYIFPQLIMQSVISNKEFDGILYTTTHYNKDFKFTYDKFLNVAIPVKEPLTKGDNCPKLSSMFTLTDATCYEFENLKGKEEARTNITWTEIGGDEKAENYKASKFSRLEECLQTFEMKSLS